MTEEQKAQALALRRVHGVSRWCESPRMPREWVQGHMGITTPVLNLADETGVVEGVLHRVLEGLVGEPVEMVCAPQSIKPPPEQWVMEWSCVRVRWRSMSVHGPSPRFNPGGYPTRLEAIVAALLALEVTK